MMTLLNSITVGECSFHEEISAHLLVVNGAIESYFQELDDHCTNAWICRRFSVKESAIDDSDVAHLSSEVDYTEQELLTYWRNVQDNCLIISKRAMTMLIQSQSTYRCEV